MERKRKLRKSAPDEDQEQEHEPSARPFWSGTITFGLVSIPVNLYPANRESRVSLRMLGSGGEPLSREYYAPDTAEDLESMETIRGYEVRKGKYVTITDEELERLAPEKSRDIDLRMFVKRDEIPPLYFKRAYFLTPADKSAKAYRLLAETMDRTRRAGIATFVMRGKESGGDLRRPPHSPREHAAVQRRNPNASRGRAIGEKGRAAEENRASIRDRHRSTDQENSGSEGTARRIFGSASEARRKETRSA